MWMFAGFFSILVTTNIAAQSCPANQIASDAQIIQSVIPVGSTMSVSNAFIPTMTCEETEISSAVSIETLADVIVGCVQMVHDLVNPSSCSIVLK